MSYEKEGKKIVPTLLSEGCECTSLQLLNYNYKLAGSNPCVLRFVSCECRCMEVVPARNSRIARSRRE